MRLVSFVAVLVALVALAACNGFQPQQPGNGGAITCPVNITIASPSASPAQTGNQATHTPSNTATGGPQSATADVRPNVNAAPGGAAGAPAPIAPPALAPALPQPPPVSTIRRAVDPWSMARAETQPTAAVVPKTEGCDPTDPRSPCYVPR